MNGRVRLEGSGLALRWSVAFSSKKKGEPTGDGFLIRQGFGRILLAVVDGTGSGSEAATAARHCIEQLSRAGLEPFEEEFHLCHLRLNGGRGAALGLARIEMATGLLTWAAVGDVDGLLIQDGDPAARRSMLQRPGTLGITYSGIHPQSQPLVAGDLFLLTTDGVSRKYRDRVSAGHSLAETAQQTLRRFGSENDDCLVLAIGVEAEA